MGTPQDRAEIIRGRLKQGLADAKRQRSSEKLHGLKLEQFWRLWLEASFNPHDREWNVKGAREEGGQLKTKEGDDRLYIAINLINEQLQAMVAREMAAKLEPAVYYEGKTTQVEAKWAQPKIDDMGLPVYPSLSMDDYVDMVKSILEHELEEMGFDDCREEVSLGRRTLGTMYLTLDWDPEAGERLAEVEFVQVKNGNSWDMVWGGYTEDGDMLKVQRQPTREETERMRAMGPESQKAYASTLTITYGGGSWRKDYLVMGRPRINVLYPWEVNWEGGVGSHLRARGVYLEYYLPLDKAQQLYPTARIEADEYEVDWKKVPTVEIQQSHGSTPQALEFYKYAPGQKMVKILEYRRKPSIKDKRSKWFLSLGGEDGEVVRAIDCPYGQSFDTSLGVYCFIDRRVPGMIEGVPTAAFMYTPNTLYSSLKSLEFELTDNMVMGAFWANRREPGQDPDISLSSGKGPRIVLADPSVTLNHLQSPAPPAHLKALADEMIQTLNRHSVDQDLLPGYRTQDLPTLGQSEMQQEMQHGKLETMIRRDAREYTRFFNDLLTLLSDPNLVCEPRVIEMIEGQGFKYREFTWTAAALAYVKKIVIGPEVVAGKDRVELQKIMGALQALPAPAAGAPDVYAPQRAGLLQRYFEILDIKGVPTPTPEQITQGNILQGAPGDPRRPGTLGALPGPALGEGSEEMGIAG